MNKSMATSLVIFGVFSMVMMSAFGWWFGNYNSAIALRNEAQTENAQIEAQLQRRADLVPNLVETTKGAMAQEKAVFEDIAKAHAAFTNAPSGEEKIQAGEALTSALRGYLVVAQQYPKLASLDIVVQLNDELAGAENRISVARQRYNKSVEKYNTRIQSVPLSFFADDMNLEEMKLYQASGSAQTAPAVKFGE